MPRSEEFHELYPKKLIDFAPLMDCDGSSIDNAYGPSRKMYLHIST